MTEQGNDNLEQELNDLKKELDNFQQEKERVRKILGKIGGIPTFNSRLMNIIFTIVIIASIPITFVGDEKVRLLMVELATVALALKIIYLIHCQMKVNHFKLWMLSSIEWRLNEMLKMLRELPKKVNEKNTE